MTDTHFDNSSGLPSPTHYTTARDLARLGGALVREFPEYYPLFSIREFIWNNIKQDNRNGLLERDPTVDGMKTGHTDSCRLLPGDLGQAQQHAPDLGGHGGAQHQGTRRCECRTPELRLYLLRDRQCAAARHGRSQAARL